MNKQNENIKQFKKVRIDTEKKVLWHGDEPVKLPVKAIELLSVLAENKGEVVSKEELLNSVWEDSFVEESVLSQNVYLLRKFFKENNLDENPIQTVPRRGYRLTSNFIEISEEILEISIERNLIERTFLAEAEIADSSIGENFRHRSGTTTNDSPKAKPLSLNLKNSLRIGLVLLVLLVFGNIFWFLYSYNSSADNNKKLSALTSFSRLTDSGNAFFPAISRDKTHTAYVFIENEQYGIKLKHNQTKSETIIVKPQKVELRSINFSADGNYIYYIAREPNYPESTIYQIPIYGGMKRKILSNVRHQFSISRDGKKFAFFRHYPETDEMSLMTSSIDGTDVKKISTRKPPQLYRVWNTYPDWSLDDKKIVVSAVNNSAPQKKENPNTYFLVIDVETGEEERVKSPNWALAYQAFWANDGKGFIVSAQETLNQPRQIWYLENSTGKTTKITNDTNHYTEFRPAFKGNSIIVNKQLRPTNLFLVDLKDKKGSVSRLTDSTSISNGKDGLIWTKDGESLVFVKNEGVFDGNIWKINIENKNIQQLTDKKDIRIRNLSLMPDGKSILFASTINENWHIWQIGIDGSNLTQFTKGIGEGSPHITSDGKWLLYKSPGFISKEIKKMSLADGQTFNIGKNLYLNGREISVNDRFDSPNKPSPANPDQLIATFYDAEEKEKSPWKFVLFSHVTEGEMKTLDINLAYGFFEWSEDGKGLYYPNKTHGENHIYYYSLETGESEPLMQIDGHRIVNLSLSPDHKKMAVAAEDIASNIFEISGF